MCTGFSLAEIPDAVGGIHLIIIKQTAFHNAVQVCDEVLDLDGQPVTSTQQVSRWGGFHVE